MDPVHSNAPSARNNPNTEFNRGFWLDIVSRALTGGLFAFCAAYYLSGAIAVTKNSVHGGNIRLADVANILSILALTFFMSLVAYLYAVRLPPISKFAGWVPAAAAFFGTFALWILLLLPARTDLSPAIRITSSCLIFIGDGFAIYSVRYLGRSFSILPQGRRLVTGGPYRYIRHPVYLAEAFATIGVLLNFLSPLAAIIVGIQFLLQLARMHYEEKVLRATFPEYEEYSRHTERLIPGIY